MTVNWKRVIDLYALGDGGRQKDRRTSALFHILDLQNATNYSPNVYNSSQHVLEQLCIRNYGLIPVSLQ